jgi:hypothetical protein
MILRNCLALHSQQYCVVRLDGLVEEADSGQAESHGRMIRCEFRTSSACYYYHGRVYGPSEIVCHHWRRSWYSVPGQSAIYCRLLQRVLELAWRPLDQVAISECGNLTTQKRKRYVALQEVPWPRLAENRKKPWVLWPLKRKFAASKPVRTHSKKERQIRQQLSDPFLAEERRANLLAIEPLQEL